MQQFSTYQTVMMIPPFAKFAYWHYDCSVLGYSLHTEL